MKKTESMTKEQKELKCPVCSIDNEFMTMYTFTKGDLEFNKCPNCNGFFFKGGALDSYGLVKKEGSDENDSTLNMLTITSLNSGLM